MSTTPEHTAVVVEDDLDIAELIAATLTQAGFSVEKVTTGSDALDRIAAVQPDLVTLDLSLPGMDGVEVCRRLREVSDCYVIMLTARAAEIDRLIGLEIGADDFMTKPFSTRELRARVAALFRRPRHGTFASDGPAPTNGGHPQLKGGGGLVIDSNRREVKIKDQIVNLTRTEFELLEHLATRAGVVCSRAELIEAIWDSAFTDSDHMIDVHIANLRRKLRQRSADDQWIKTVRGVGFRFDPVA